MDFGVVYCCKVVLKVGFESGFCNSVSSVSGDMEEQPTERIPYVFLAAFSSLLWGYQGDKLHDFDKTLELFVRSLPLS